MVKADNLYLVVRAVNTDGLLIAHREIILSLSELRTQSDFRPIGLLQGARDIEGVDIDNTNDFQRVGLSLLRAAVGVLDRPIAKFSRIEDCFSTGSHSGKHGISLGHGNGGAVIGVDMALSRRTLLAQGVESVIHRGVRPIQFQCRFRSVVQQICFAQRCSHHITTGVCTGGVGI